MPKSILKTVVTALLLSLSLTLGAQKLPSLKAAPEISTFSLPSGLNCYVVTSKAETSRADFALIQAGPAGSRASESDLDSLEHFAPGRPDVFLKTNAILFNAEKYPFGGDEATVFRFEGVNVSASAVADTTLLMLFDIASLCPYTQAIVVSGDISAAAISDKLRALSMLLSRRSPLPRTQDPGFVRQPFPMPDIRLMGEGAEVSLTFAAARTPRALMATVQPALTRMFFSNLSAILEQRLKVALREAGLHFYDIRFRYTGSAQSAGDETYRIIIGTDADCAWEVSDVLNRTIADVSAGVEEDEFREARERTLMEERISIALGSETNSGYIRRCASNFIFGASLASRSAENDYFTARPLPLATECGIFRKFISALFEGCPITPGPSRPVLAMGDTLSLKAVSAKKKDALKINVESKEPASGGQMWTFSNGIRVIYKKVPTSGVFQYSLMLRGGCGDIPGFRRGEMAFVSDALRLSTVSGMPAASFRRMLEANAITMEANASVSDLRISGTAVKERFPLLLKSLVSVAMEREADTVAVRQFLSEERLRLESNRGNFEALAAHMDSLLRPDYNYLNFKDISNLSPDLPARSQQYFSSQFAKFNDGVLVIFGDLDEAQVKAQLCRYLAPLSVSRSYAVRPQISYSQRSGWSTYTEKSASSGGRFRYEGIFMAMSTLSTVSVSDYMAVQMAAEVLESGLGVALSRAGYRVNVQTQCEFFPLERVSVIVSVIPGRGARLSPLEMVPATRDAMAEIAAGGVSASELNTLKSYFTKDYETRLTRPDFLVDLTLARYSDGKDFVSDYKARIASVKAEDIKNILYRWYSGGKIEYIISR